MKKFLAMLLCLMATCVFVGCIPIPEKTEVRTEVEDITSIEIYYLEKYVDWDGEKWWLEEWNSGETISWEYKCEPIAYVQEADYATFVADAEALPHIFGLPIIPVAIDPSWRYHGYVIKINSGTNCELICQSGGGSISYYEDEDWKPFIKKYIGEELFAQIEQATQSNDLE